VTAALATSGFATSYAPTDPASTIANTGAMKRRESIRFHVPVMQFFISSLLLVQLKI
jgi:hypothetical protein